MLRKIWRRLTAPTFSVTTIKGNHDMPTGAAVAGHKTKICTISICLHSDPIFGRHREEIDFPRPSFNSVQGVKVSFSEDRRPRREELELDVYVQATIAGKYYVTPGFPEDRYNFRSIDKSPVAFYVKPSDFKFIELSSIEPVPGHGKARSVYRGGTVEILLTARDEFGNITVESDLRFKIDRDNPFVALLSTTRDVQKERYIVTLRCDQVGVTSFNFLLLSHALHPLVKVTGLNIIPPPASSTNSYIIQNDLQSIQEKIHEAGKPITFRMAMFDIFGYPLTSLNEITGNIHLTCVHECDTNRSFGDHHITDKAEEEEHQRLEKEADSLKVRTCDLADSTNIFELQFTPLSSGQKCFLLHLSEKELKNSPIKITVEPGPLVELQLVSHQPPISNLQNVVFSYPTEQRVVVFKGIDACGNKVDLELTEWILSETQYANMLEVENSFLDEKAKVVLFHYTHGKKGRYTVTVKPKSPTTKSYIKVPQFVVEVGSAPINPKRCDVRICQEQPIFTGHFRCIQLRVAFVSCTGEGYVFPNRDIGNLSVAVDNVVYRPTFKRSPKPFGACLLLPDLQEGGMKKIQVRYKETCLGCQVTVNVVGLVPFKTDDYLEVYQNEQKILCIGVAQKQFIGADHANIKNMNRILEKEYPGNELSHNVSQECEGVAVFDLSSFQLEAFWRVFVLLALLIRGTEHFRNQANEFGDEKKNGKKKQLRHITIKTTKKQRNAKLSRRSMGS